MWAYREHLPAPCRLATADPWQGASGANLAQAPPASRVNKTPRIAAATMESLLAWSLRMVEDIGPDIAAAWADYRQLRDGEHPSQQPLPRAGGRRPAGVVPRPGAAGRGGPARQAPRTTAACEINTFHVARLLGLRGHPLTAAQLRTGGELRPAGGRRQLCRRRHRKGRRQAVAGPAITATELPDLARFLTAACFVTVCYLSGMRPGEALNLPARVPPGRPGEWRAPRGGPPRQGTRPPAAHRRRRRPQRPWAVVEPVHDRGRRAGTPVPPPRSCSPPAHRQRPEAPRRGQSTPGCRAASTRDLEEFTAWVNATFTAAGGARPIPPDPTRHMHPSRFRRPSPTSSSAARAGLIAAALQYGHVSTRVTLAYAGDADTSWMDDLAVERLELMLEQAGARPAAARRRRTRQRALCRRVPKPASRAPPVSRPRGHRVRNVERLLARADANVHHGEAMTCVWSTETAACRKAKLAAGLPADDAPDEAECRSTCLNLAYTDRDIGQLRRRLAALVDAGAADPLAPRPLRDRAGGPGRRRRSIIARHESTRPAGHPGATGRLLMGRAPATKTPSGPRSRRRPTGCSPAHPCARPPANSPAPNSSPSPAYGATSSTATTKTDKVVESFKSRVKARNAVPKATQQLADDNERLTRDLKDIRAALSNERIKTKVLLRVASELSLELEQAREELAAARQVTRLPAHRRPSSISNAEPQPAINTLPGTDSKNCGLADPTRYRRQCGAG